MKRLILVSGLLAGLLVIPAIAQRGGGMRSGGPGFVGPRQGMGGMGGGMCGRSGPRIRGFGSGMPGRGPENRDQGDVRRKRDPNGDTGQTRERERQQQDQPQHSHGQNGTVR